VGFELSVRSPPCHAICSVYREGPQQDLRSPRCRSLSAVDVLQTYRDKDGMAERNQERHEQMFGLWVQQPSKPLIRRANGLQCGQCGSRSGRSLSSSGAAGAARSANGRSWSGALDTQSPAESLLRSAPDCFPHASPISVAQPGEAGIGSEEPY
jgi:hypothetical protein